MTDYTLLDELKTFTIARFQQSVNNTTVPIKDRKSARDSIRWINTVVYEVRGHRRALPIGVAILAKYARRWRNHPDYDPLWDTIDLTGG